MMIRLNPNAPPGSLVVKGAAVDGGGDDGEEGMEVEGAAAE